jgi:epoxyqueuosine reductase
MTPALSPSLEQRVKERAASFGFDPVGITRLGPATTYDAFAGWLNQGFSGEMSYLATGAERRRDTTLPFPGARVAVVVALDYGGKQRAGSIARYARGDDYHDVMLGRLNELHRWLQIEHGHAIAGKAYVDTAPILERDLAQRAGLGWIGKNTMLISPKRGSFFFLGALFLDLDLAPDTPFEADRCGSCTRCLDACPTGAFVAPRVMDARRCISYLTIEHRSEIAPELQPLMGELLYGCDICQDVCPWNHKFASELPDPALAPRPENVEPDPAELLALDDAGFRDRFRRSPIKRTKRAGLARNAAVVLRNRQRRPS